MGSPPPRAKQVVGRGQGVGGFKVISSPPGSALRASPPSPSGREKKETSMAAPDTSAVTGTPRLLLRLEGLGLFGLAILLSVWIGTPWWLFALLFLVPDLSFAGYLADPR